MAKLNDSFHNYEITDSRLSERIVKISNKPRKINRKIFDDLLEMLLGEFPDARVMVINPQDQKDANLPKYQYRNIRIKADKYCPPQTIYLKK
jgi:hypothetical protein